LCQDPSLKLAIKIKKKCILQNRADDIGWLPEARALELCELTRSSFNSWKTAGIDIEPEGGAYGLAQVVPLLLLVAARSYLPPKEMVGAWRDLKGSGEIDEIVNAARGLKEGGRFDLVIEPAHAALRVARSDSALLDAVRHPGAPRPVVVLDLAERVRQTVGAFNRIANRTTPPAERSRGRPRSADRSNVRAFREKDG
jgi:hypothetical protein